MKSIPIFAVDPGREKCGYAILTPADTGDSPASQGAAGGDILPRRGIVATPDLATVWRGVSARYPDIEVVVGGGTGSAAVIETLTAAGARCVVVNEQNTTRRARERYYMETPPRGWQRLVPRMFLSPPVPVDDLAALILGEDYCCAADLQPLRESVERKGPAGG